MSSLSLLQLAPPTVTGVSLMYFARYLGAAADYKWPLIATVAAFYAETVADYLESVPGFTRLAESMTATAAAAAIVSGVCLVGNVQGTLVAVPSVASLQVFAMGAVVGGVAYTAARAVAIGAAFGWGSKK